MVYSRAFLHLVSHCYICYAPFNNGNVALYHCMLQNTDVRDHICFGAFVACLRTNQIIFTTVLVSVKQKAQTHLVCCVISTLWNNLKCVHKQSTPNYP